MVEQLLGDRRPIASRNARLWQLTAHALARHRISANAISVVGMLCALAAATCLAFTPFVQPLPQRLLFAAAAAGIQLRLLANMLDGMVAIARGTASTLGELFNEIPDRISDTAILVAAGYAAGGLPSLGWAAACLALFITYIRAVGKTMGVPGLFHGPMSKSHRMFILTLACLYLALTPAAWQPTLTFMSVPLGLISITLILIIAGGLITAFRRLSRIIRGVQKT